MVVHEGPENSFLRYIDFQELHTLNEGVTLKTLLNPINFISGEKIIVRDL